jgi:DNA-binding SARP family transcriptional activator
VTGELRTDRPAVDVALLGGFRLTVDNHAVHTTGAEQRLVAYVALCSPTTRTMTAGTLWPDVDEQHAHASLRTSMWQVHRRCPELVNTLGTDLRLGEDVDVDAIALVVHAHRILRAPSTLSVAHLTAELISQELLPGWYDDWVLTERERSRQLQLHALEAAAEELLARHQTVPALDVALRAVSTEPLRESAHRLVIRIHISEGNIGEAIRQYSLCRQLLGDELGVEPTPQLRRLVND